MTANPPMTTPEQIAKGLSEAQKCLVLALDPVQYRDWKTLSRNVRTRNKVAALDLAWFDDSKNVMLFFMRRLSPLGLAVREVLMKEIYG